MIESSRIKKIHFAGIGGSGMSGIAEVLHNMGFQISGSDIAENDTVRRLRAMGMRIAVGHAAANVGGGGSAGLFQRHHRGQRRGPRSAAQQAAGHPARGDAGRADAHEVLAGRRRHARQDHDHLHDRRHPDPGPPRPHLRGRRPAEGRRQRRQARFFALPGRRGRRVGRQLSEALSHHRRGDQHRERPPGILRQHEKTGPGLPPVRRQGALLRGGDPEP